MSSIKKTPALPPITLRVKDKEGVFQDVTITSYSAEDNEGLERAIKQPEKPIGICAKFCFRPSGCSAKNRCKFVHLIEADKTVNEAAGKRILFVPDAVKNKNGRGGGTKNGDDDDYDDDEYDHHHHHNSGSRRQQQQEESDEDDGSGVVVVHGSSASVTKKSSGAFSYAAAVAGADPVAAAAAAATTNNAGDANNSNNKKKNNKEDATSAAASSSDDLRHLLDQLRRLTDSSPNATADASAPVRILRSKLANDLKARRLLKAKFAEVVSDAIKQGKVRIGGVLGDSWIELVETASSNGAPAAATDNKKKQQQEKNNNKKDKQQQQQQEKVTPVASPTVSAAAAADDANVPASDIDALVAMLKEMLDELNIPRIKRSKLAAELDLQKLLKCKFRSVVVAAEHQGFVRLGGQAGESWIELPAAAAAASSAAPPAPASKSAAAAAAAAAAAMPNDNNKNAKQQSNNRNTVSVAVTSGNGNGSGISADELAKLKQQLKSNYDQQLRENDRLWTDRLSHMESRVDELYDEIDTRDSEIAGFKQREQELRSGLAGELQQRDTTIAALRQQLQMRAHELSQLRQQEQLLQQQIRARDNEVAALRQQQQRGAAGTPPASSGMGFAPPPQHHHHHQQQHHHQYVTAGGQPQTILLASPNSQGQPQLQGFQSQGPTDPSILAAVAGWQ